MARPIPPERFAAIVRAATAVFIAQGYRRTQMADVAAELGVAKGTLYLYVESKEALFEQVVRHADHPGEIALPKRLPVAAPSPGSTLRLVRSTLAQEAKLPVLRRALTARRAPDTRSELEAIVRELYQLLSRHRVAIKLVDRCAHDYPELADVWFSVGRGGVVSLLERYLRKRIAAKRLPPVADPSVTARLVLETAVHWAVHRHWDAAPQAVSDELAEAAVVEFVTRALAPE